MSHSLVAELSDSYINHPDFKFEFPELILPLDEFNSFNNLFIHSRKLSSFLGEDAMNELKRVLKARLAAVFKLLIEQSFDEFERLFLVELEEQVLRLVMEEFSWYSNSRKFSVNQLSPANCPLALEMESQKYFIGALPKNVISRLCQICEGEIESFRENAKKGILKREALSINHGATIRKMCSVLNREFKKLGVLDVMSAYLGRKLRVTGLSLELSVPQSGWWHNHLPSIARGPHTLYAHLDESISYPKAIIYLTNVSPKNGPTSCYPGVFEDLGLNPLQELIGRVVGVVGSTKGSPLADYYSKQYHQSVGSQNFRKHFMRLPSEMRFNSHFGWDVMPDSSLERTLVDREVQVIGGAGTFIAFDGSRLLHRGGLIDVEDRLVLQVVFSDMTVIKEILTKIKNKLKSL